MTLFSDKNFAGGKKAVSLSDSLKPVLSSTTVIYPFSADPPTLAHIDIVCRISKLFERVIWAIGVNGRKKPLLSIEEKLACCYAVVRAKGWRNVEVHAFSGAVVDFARTHNSRILIRGIRSSSDVESEYRQAEANTALDAEIETMFLLAHASYSAFSSSVVRELLFLEKPIWQYVSPEVERILSRQFSYLT